MTTRLRLDAAPGLREEIHTRGGDEGEALRQQIYSAFQRGAPTAEIEVMQERYRHMPLMTRQRKPPLGITHAHTTSTGSMTHTHANGDTLGHRHDELGLGALRPGDVGKVLRDASDPSREIEAILCTFDPVWTSLHSDGSGSALMQIQRRAFDKWLSTNPRPPVLLDHEIKVGYFRELHVEDDGLHGTALLDDTPAGERVLRAAEDGEVVAFSVHILIAEERDLPIVIDGEACRVVTEGRIREGGPCLSPADPAAQVLTVRGVVPQWKRVAEARERDRLMRNRRRLQYEGLRSW